MSIDKLPDGVVPLTWNNVERDDYIVSIDGGRRYKIYKMNCEFYDTKYWYIRAKSNDGYDIQLLVRDFDERVIDNRPARKRFISKLFG